VRLYLIRHGESTWNAERRIQGQADPPLSARGHRQAARLAERLRPLPLAAIYASSQQRACQTAEHIARGHDVSVVPRDDLREVCVGIFEGFTAEELEAQHPEKWARWQAEVWRYAIPGAETQDDFQRRIWQAMSEIRTRHPGEHVAVVTHGGVISMYLSTLLEIDIWQWSRFSQGNTALNIVEVSDGRARIVCLNDRCHLDE
jgi:probable phosphoglycerate mutase